MHEICMSYDLVLLSMLLEVTWKLLCKMKKEYCVLRLSVPGCSLYLIICGIYKTFKGTFPWVLDVRV